jgi:ubiquinone/menaquinone biosynthesis C-methylase UbiE
MTRVENNTPGIDTQIELNLARQRNFDLVRSDNTFNRSGVEYVKQLLGIRYSLEYIRLLNPGEKAVVLDEGAGTTRGISHISNSVIGSGLDFRATVLSTDSRVLRYLGLDKTRITSIEVLEGIEDNSISLITSVFGGMSNTPAPEMAVEQIDRVLKPGGVLKAKLGRNHYVYQTFLEGMGYGVYEKALDRLLILIAIKGRDALLAEKLFELDKTDYFTQMYSLLEMTN